MKEYMTPFYCNGIYKVSAYIKNYSQQCKLNCYNQEIKKSLI